MAGKEPPGSQSLVTLAQSFALIAAELEDFSRNNMEKPLLPSGPQLKKYIKVLFDVLVFFSGAGSSSSKSSLLWNTLANSLDCKEEIEWCNGPNAPVEDKEKIVCLLVFQISSGKCAETLVKIAQDKPKVAGFDDILRSVREVDLLDIRVDSKIIKNFQEEKESKLAKSLPVQDLKFHEFKSPMLSSAVSRKVEEDPQIHQEVSPMLKKQTPILLVSASPSRPPRPFKSRRADDSFDQKDSRVFESGVMVSHSALLFKEKFEKILQKYSYMPKPDLTALPANNKKQCSICHKSIDGVLSMFKRGFCYFTYTWNCSNCIAAEKMRIPWKVLEEFDLSLYTVSNNVAIELESFYDKPSLELPINSAAVKKNQNLTQFIILQRELHLLYDSICRPSIVADLMPNYLNLLLKKHLLSVKNFVEIESGSLLLRMNDWLKQYKDHFLGCERCNQKGLVCGQCKDQDSKVFLFDVRDSKICKKCQQIYHRICWAAKGCVRCQD